MTMYDCLIVEDEPAVARQLAGLINHAHPEMEIAGIAHNVDSAIEMLELHSPQILFLDINLGHQTGFDLLQQLEQPGFEIIIVTAFDQFAIEALRWSAADYLLKPVQPAELHAGLQRVYKRLKQDKASRVKRAKYTLDQLMMRMAAEQVQVALPMAGELLLVKAGDIVQLEADGSYSRFYFAAGNSLLISRGLFYFEQKLTELGFVRCHAAHLVNRRYIQKLLQSDGILELVLFNEQRIPVSRKYHKQIKELLRTW